VKIWLKIALNAVRLPKFEPVIVVAEKDHGKRFGLKTPIHAPKIGFFEDLTPNIGGYLIVTPKGH